MSLEAITKIRSVEENMDQAKADAKARAQKLAAEAERVSVPAWNQDTCIQCNQCAYVCPHATIRPFAMTEEEAAKRRDDILRQAEKDCEALKKQAGSRMDKAAQAILGRVVGN